MPAPTVEPADKTLARIRGCLFGLACGDALGWPTEFDRLEIIRSKYGPQGIQELPDPALVTDDTQMTVAVARALCRGGRADIEPLAKAMAEEFVAWSVSPENDRAPGNTCLAGCRNLQHGASWRSSGSVSSKGCGANMRVAPVALYYRRTPERIAPAARLSALLTHAHPAALAAAEATAWCVYWALLGVHPSEYLDRLRVRARTSVWDAALGNPWAPADADRRFAEGWQELLRALLRVPAALRARPDNYCAVLGGAWVADEALACALYCVLSHPDDYLAVVRLGANSDGDSDSIACIAGAIAGARLGIEAVPADWRRRIEGADRLDRLANDLAAGGG